MGAGLISPASPTAPQLAEYLHELTAFPRGRHDDQVDSTAQILDWFKQAGRELGGIYQWYKMRAAELRASPKRPAPLSALLPFLRQW